MAPLIGIGLPAGFIIPAQPINIKLQKIALQTYWVHESA